MATATNDELRNIFNRAEILQDTLGDKFFRFLPTVCYIHPLTQTMPPTKKKTHAKELEQTENQKNEQKAPKSINDLPSAMFDNLRSAHKKPTLASELIS